MPSVGEDVEWLASYSLLVGMQIELLLGKIHWQFFIKLNTHIVYSTAFPLLSTSPREWKYVSTQRLVLKFRTALFILILVKCWKELRHPSADEEISEQWCPYTLRYPYGDIYSSHGGRNTMHATARMFSRDPVQWQRPDTWNWMIPFIWSSRKARLWWQEAD